MATEPGFIRRWLWRTLGVTTAIAVMICGLLFARQLRWSGSYELTIRFENQGAPIRSVTCEMFPRREVAEQSVENFIPPETATHLAVIEPYAGEPLQMRVPVDGKCLYYVPVELSRTQFHALAVIATYADGRRVGQVVDIPDGRESHEVTVTFR